MTGACLIEAQLHRASQIRVGDDVGNGDLEFHTLYAWRLFGVVLDKEGLPASVVDAAAFQLQNFLEAFDDRVVLTGLLLILPSISQAQDNVLNVAGVALFPFAQDVEGPTMAWTAVVIGDVFPAGPSQEERQLPATPSFHAGLVTTDQGG
ncbi:hypothetical protein [Streptomyces zagrosensis]|uniref:Uncharacterized protein n=1 Tax=Streptomyces zagrosensis TaxID=1042984 RepID=A0A7W9UWB0_9ACTN|nr:hypothetical protein [Streptomyces zagrosensis]MBB5933121.1 hypothetical protein [Streptomyces zagrosensis]